MKITLGNRSVLVLLRSAEEAAEYARIIRSISSTEIQEYCGINFLDGQAVGGRTMTKGEVAALIAMANKNGSVIEGERFQDDENA